MKVFVTGINGYLGYPLLEELSNHGFEVVGFDTNFFATWALYPVRTRPQKFIKKDVRQVTPEDLSQCDAVVHLAELSNDPLGELDASLTEDINHRGTVHLAKTAKKAGVKRFIYYSSCSVYGASENVADEKSEVNPLTNYAKCKVLNENFLLSLQDDNFSPVILRNATAFGVSPNMRFDLVVNNLCALAWINHEIKMDSDGMPWRPFVHAKDIARAARCALQAEKKHVAREFFNVGSSKSNYQIKDIAQIVAQVFPNCKTSFNPQGADKRNYRVNFEKITTKLPGFSCERDVALGVKELYALFQKINFAKNQFEANEFTRLKQIKSLTQNGLLDKNLYWKNN